MNTFRRIRELVDSDVEHHNGKLSLLVGSLPLMAAMVFDRTIFREPSALGAILLVAFGSWVAFVLARLLLVEGSKLRVLWRRYRNRDQDPDT